MSNPPTDAQIRAQILGSQTERQAIFAWLYQKSGWREWVVRHVGAEGGDGPAGEDVFQETVIILDRNLREGRFRGESGLKTYFFGIAKQFWFNRRRSARRLVATETPERTDLPSGETPEKTMLETERRAAVESILAALGDPCRRVLALWKLSMTNEEIARELGLSSPDMAKKYSWRCREKFRAFVLERPQLIDLLNIAIDDEKQPG